LLETAEILFPRPEHVAVLGRDPARTVFRGHEIPEDGCIAGFSRREGPALDLENESVVEVAGVAASRPGRCLIVA
jgi:hypothetical protein